MLSLLRKALDAVLPPPAWQFPVFALLGLTAGIGAVVFWQSRAWSYLSDSPSACINCHIMMPQYSTWQHSSHARVASCNDCHVPHTSMAAKYFFKAKDGSRHATLFTLGMEEEVIKITPPSKAVVQDNCLRCHATLNEGVSTSRCTGRLVKKDQERACWDCHREVPHGRVNSLSSVPNARIQLETPTIPAWMNPAHRNDGARP